MKIGIYGGTFDPIHLGHMAAARAAVRTLGLDRLLLIPAGLPPHKSLSECAAPAEDRLEMTRIAADRLALELSVPVEVSEMEVHREGKSYTSDTLRILKEQYPEDELWVLMGSDMFLSLQTWHEPEVILRLAGICAFGREEGDCRAQFEEQTARLEERYPGCRITVLHIPDLVEVSSTEIRDRLSAGEEPEELDPSVYGYILRKDLYHTDADLKHLTWSQLRAASYSMIRAKRIPHVQGIESEAVKLARRWGADEDEARRAAILHDCTKYLDLNEQLQLCSKYGILLDNMEKNTLKLLHSKTGAAIAKAEFGASDEVYWAIYWHTTGKADMSLLEKIIYIADYMEPSRSFDGVEEVRDLVYRDLDAALLMGIEQTIELMKEMGNPVHYRSLEARDWLIARGVRTCG